MLNWRQPNKCMNQPLDVPSLILLAIAAGVPAYYWLQVARRKRQMLRFKARRILVYLATIMIGLALIPQYGYSIAEACLFSICLGATLAFSLIRPPSTNRRIPAKIRRQVIARDLKGERFDPNVHDIDHIVPFSKGGDHSLENLRVVHRTENRRRGAKMPTLKDFS